LIEAQRTERIGDAAMVPPARAHDAIRRKPADGRRVRQRALGDHQIRAAFEAFDQLGRCSGWSVKSITW
jgi:hypothetical protein